MVASWLFSSSETQPRQVSEGEDLGGFEESGARVLFPSRSADEDNQREFRDFDVHGEQTIASAGVNDPGSAAQIGLERFHRLLAYRAAKELPGFVRPETLNRMQQRPQTQVTPIPESGAKVFVNLFWSSYIERNGVLFGTSAAVHAVVNPSFNRSTIEESTPCAV